MNITGTVLLNARGVNINGYDCFVNLSKDTKNEKIENFTYIAPAGDTNYQLFPNTPTFTKVSSSKTKFSPITLYYQNQVNIGIRLPSFNIITSSTDYTISYWYNGVNIPGVISSITGYQIRGVANAYSFINCSMQSDSSSNNIIHFGCEQNNGTWAWSNTSIDCYNKWVHYAFTKSGSTVRIFINGVKVFENSNAKFNTLHGGGVYLRNYAQTKYADDIVVIANQALWTSNFTPPSTYLLDSEYAINLDQVNRRNIIAANVDKKIIIPDEPLKQY